jgi:hypothetical protein
MVSHVIIPPDLFLWIFSQVVLMMVSPTKILPALLLFLLAVLLMDLQEEALHAPALLQVVLTMDLLLKVMLAL